MTTPNDGGPAFPRPVADVEVTDTSRQPRYNTPQTGMSLRDWFAGQALAGIMANCNPNTATPEGNSEAAYVTADAMLFARQALDKTEKGGSRA